MIIKSIPDTPGAPTPKTEVPAAFLPPGGQKPQRRALRAPPPTIYAAAQTITKLCSKLGIDPTDLSDTTSKLLLKVSPLAPTQARYLVIQLPLAPILTQRSGVTVEKLSSSLSKLGPLLSLHGHFLQQQSDVADSLQVTGTAMRQEWRNIYARVTAALPEGVPLTDAQRRLKQVWQPIADFKAKMAQDVADKLDAGKKASQQRATELAMAGNDQELLKTMIDLQSGQQVDDATAAQAVATYQQQQAQSQASDLSPLLSTPAKAGPARRSRR